MTNKADISIGVDLSEENLVQTVVLETEVMLGGKDGKDGYTPQKGTDYFDGERGRSRDLPPAVRSRWNVVYDHRRRGGASGWAGGLYRVRTGHV